MKYAVIDLEMCMVPKGFRKYGYKYRQETIQIGAVLLDENYEVIDEFNTYVKPEYGWIDDFIEKLTGISQHNVADAPSFEEALEAFLDWLPADDVRCVSWSDSDPKQIIHESFAKGMTSLKIIEQGSLSKGYSAPSVRDYRMNLPQYCEIASKVMFEHRLIDYEVDGNIVNLTFRSRSGKTAWQSEIVFKKDGHICWSTPFCDNSTFFFGNRVLEVA